MHYKLLIVGFIICSCSPARMIETDLYFGQSKPGGGTITEMEWKNFKENYIAKVFKEGSTVYHAEGNWLDAVSNQLITEPTYVVVYIYKHSPQKSKQIDSLRYWYKTMFQQQSILRIDKKVKVNF
jgi:hypothetical protein